MEAPLFRRALYLLTYLTCLRAQPLFLDIRPHSERCFFEELVKHEVVRAAVAAVEDTVSIRLTDPTGANVFMRADTHSENMTVRVRNAGEHMLCISAKRAARVSLLVRVGLDPRRPSGAAGANGKGPQRPIADDLAHIVGTLYDVQHDMQVVGARDWVARDVQDSTNSRMLCFSAFSILVLSSMAIWQLYWFRVARSRPKRD